MRIQSKRLLSLTAVAASAVLAVSACGGGGDGTTPPTGSPGFAACDADPDTCNSGPVKQGGELTYAIEQEWTSWAQFTDEGNQFALTQVLQGVLPQVYRFLPSGKHEWNMDLLAEEPQMTSTSPQTMVYKFRPEAKWDDGTDITADDVILQWKMRSGDESHCAGCLPASTSGWDKIEKIEGSDNGKTVTITLKEGQVHAEWIGIVDALYPAHLAKAAGADLNTPEGVAQAEKFFAENVPTWSGGPYKIDQFTQGQAVIQVPNPNWYGKTKPALEKLTFRFITDQGGLIPALQNREIHAAAPQPNPDLVQQAGQIPGVHYRVGHGYQWEHIDLNLQNKWLADVELRKAIFTAISIKEINDKTFGSFDPKIQQLGNHVFMNGTEYYKDVITPTGQGSGDIEKAKKILTDAGYTIDGDKLKKDGEEVPAFRFRHTEGNQLRATTAEIVQSALKNIGIRIDIEPTATLGETLASGDYDIMIFAWVGTPFFLDGTAQIWRTGGGGNYGKYSNAEVDKLIDEALQQTELSAAAEKVNQAMEIMAKDAYVLPIAQKPTFLMVYDDYLNIRDNPTNQGVNYNNHEWGLKASAN